MGRFDKLTGLTLRQEALCVEFVRCADGNASAAYRKAYNAGNMKPASVKRQAFRLINKPRVAARIADLRAIAVRKAELSIDHALEELCNSAFVDPIALFDAEGDLRKMKDIPEHARRAIASIVVQQDGKVRVKLCDKLVALEKLMRFLGAFEKHNAQTGSLWDNIPRPVLKEIEACLQEAIREYEAGKSKESEPVC